MLPGKRGRRVYLSIDAFLRPTFHSVNSLRWTILDRVRRRVDVPHAPFLRRFPKGGRFVFTFITAPLSGGSLTRVWRAARGFLRCVSGASGRACQRYRLPGQQIVVFPKRTWRVVLVWCPLPMLLLAHSERGTEHFFPRPLTQSGGRGISHIAERGVINYEAEIYDFHRDTTEDRCNRRIAV